MIKKRVSQNDAASRAQPRQRGIRLLALLRKIPLVDAADPGSRALAEAHQPLLEIFVLEWFEFVENREQDQRSDLRQHNKQHHEHGPRNEPPVLGRLANREI